MPRPLGSECGRGAARGPAWAGGAALGAMDPRDHGAPQEAVCAWLLEALAAERAVIANAALGLEQQHQVLVAQVEAYFTQLQCVPGPPKPAARTRTACGFPAAAASADS